MLLKKYFLLLFTFFLTVSCVSTKRITYFQESKHPANEVMTLSKQPAPYRMQVGDVLSIRIKAIDQELVSFFNSSSSEEGTLGEGAYYDGFAIDVQGNIRIPTLGKVYVLGKTVEEIRLRIEERLLKEYIKEEANIFVTVKLAGITYTIGGEVGGSGVKTELVERLSIFDAIANNGGVTDTGDLTAIRIIRNYPGGQRIHTLDLTSIEVMNSPYYYVQPNDVIIVNPLPQKALGIGTTGLSAFTTIVSVITTFATVVLLLNR